MALSIAVIPGATRAEDADPGYWLRFGKPLALCSGARNAMPAKVQGDAWGILASGVVLCRDTGDSYTLDISYLNVSIDPEDHAMLKRDTVTFDWIGLSLYRPARQGGGVDWLFDASRPIKGTLRRDATGRIVFGNIDFKIPKQPAGQATNLLLYLTFDGPLVALRIL